MIMTIQEKQFNVRFAEYLKKAIKEPNIFKIMLKANELYAESFGYYPKTDQIWIEKLCFELLQIIEDIAWEQFPLDNEESHDMLAYMSICELSAVKMKQNQNTEI